MVSSSAFELRGLRPTVLYMSSFGAIFLMLRYRAHHREVSVRQQAKRSVPLPAVPRAYLVLIETDLSLGHLETVFYGPAPARDPDQLVDGRLRRAIGEVVGVLGGIFDAPAHQQPATRLRLIWIGQGRASPVVKPFSLGPLPGRGPKPRLLGQVLCHRARLPLVPFVVDALGPRHRQHVPPSPLLEPSARKPRAVP